MRAGRQRKKKKAGSEVNEEGETKKEAVGWSSRSGVAQSCRRKVNGGGERKEEEGWQRGE